MNGAHEGDAGQVVSSALYPFQSRFCSLQGFRCHYVDEGSGRPVIMLHGNPTWSFHFRTLIAGLREECRAIAPDHIGMGLSDKPDASRYRYDLESRIQDFTAFLDHLGLERDITLVMHDWGGMIGMGYAARFPDRISRLVILNSAAFHVPDGMRVPLPFLLVRGTSAGRWLVQHTNLFGRVAVHVCCKRQRLPADVRRAYFAPYHSTASRLGILQFVLDAPIHPADRSFPLLSAIESGLRRFRDVPALICWGDRDFVFTPRVLDVWRGHWPHADVHRFADCGHFLMEDAPDEVLGLVRSFLRGH